jgi:catechol 2,3-dioxygenase-like lactoylglutathione lyase family enzyme
VSKNLVLINPFFIVADLRASISYYQERLGFQLDFQGPRDDPYYGRVSRDGIGIMLKAILPEVPPRPNHTRHAWARWDAFVYCLDPDVLFEELEARGASFVKELSYIDEGLWGFEVADGDGYVLAFARQRRDRTRPPEKEERP